MTLLGRAAQALDRAGVAFAAIGGVALATHGFCRSTFGIDLLTVEDRCLAVGFWGGLEGVEPGVSRAAPEDPLAGLVRLRQRGERPVDVFVGRAPWQREAVQRAGPIRVLDAVIPVVEAADLVLLKLYAGGALDLWDVAQLLAADAPGRLAAEVEKRLGSVPPDASAHWTGLRRA